MLTLLPCAIHKVWTLLIIPSSSSKSSEQRQTITVPLLIYCTVDASTKGLAESADSPAGVGCCAKAQASTGSATWRSWNSEEEGWPGHVSLQRGLPGSGPRWATLEAGARRGTHPPVALPFHKARVRAGLQVVDRQPGPGTCFEGRYLGTPAVSTW